MKDPSTETERLAFFYIKNHGLFKENKPELFQNKGIRSIYQIYYDYYKEYSSTPSIDTVKSEAAQNGLSQQSVTILLNQEDNYNRLLVESRDWLYGLIQDFIISYKMKSITLELIDKNRESSDAEDIRMAAADTIRELERIANFKIGESEEGIKKDEFGRIDYKKLTNKEIKDFHTVLSRAPISSVLNYTFNEFNPNIKYKTSAYLIYPLLKEGQLGILFGRSGEGKSILAMEIANFIAQGKSDWEFFKVETKPQTVVYLNYELSASSIASRYKPGKFHDNLKIINVNVYEYNSYIGFGQKQQARLNKALDYIEEIAGKYDSKVLFIDNLSNIADSVEQAAEADRFVSDLYGRMKALDLTIFFIGHTPKVANSSQISMNQLKGSSSLSKTFETMIGFQRAAKDKNISYIKQVKTRDVEFIFDESNVGKFEFEPDGKFGWGLNFIGTDTEENLIDERKTNEGRPPKYDNAIKIDVLYDLLVGKQGPLEIQKDYQISRSTYYNFLKEYELNKDGLKDEYESFLANKSNNFFA